APTTGTPTPGWARAEARAQARAGARARGRTARNKLRHLKTPAPGHDDDQRPHPGDPVMAGHARFRAPCPGIPDRCAMGRRGTANPIYDPGAIDPCRDGHGPAVAAGRPEVE